MAQEPPTASIQKLFNPREAHTTQRPLGYPGSLLEKNRILKDDEDVLKGPKPAEIILAHFQFYEDRATDRLQVLADELQYTDCQADLRNLVTLQLKSLFSPLLAAKAAGFSECHRLEAYDQTRILIRCN